MDMYYRRQNTFVVYASATIFPIFMRVILRAPVRQLTKTKKKEIEITFDFQENSCPLSEVKSR